MKDEKVLSDFAEKLYESLKKAGFRNIGKRGSN